MVGAIVAYTQAFLSRHNHYLGGMPSVHGRVTALDQMDNGNVLADIQWNKPGLPKRVNTKHLTVLTSTPTGEAKALDAVPGNG
jgi:hypothetical protein